MRLKQKHRDACDTASLYDSAMIAEGLTVLAPAMMPVQIATGGFQWRRTVTQYDSAGHFLERTVGHAVTHQNDAPSPMALRHDGMCYVMTEFSRGGNGGYEKTTIQRARSTKFLATLKVEAAIDQLYGSEQGDYKVEDIARMVGADSFDFDSLIVSGWHIQLDGSCWHDMGSQHGSYKQWTVAR